MPLATPSIALDQAILFLDGGRNPVPDADFKALGATTLPVDNNAYVAFILAARAGELPLWGTLCLNIVDCTIPGPEYFLKEARITISLPLKTTTRVLANDFAIPSKELTRDRINFKTSLIRCEGVPTGAGPLPEPTSNEKPFYYFEKVRVGAVELRALRSVYAAGQQPSRADEARLKSGSKCKYEYKVVMAEVVAILHEEGLEGRSLAWLVAKVQEKLGGAAPGDSTLKDMLGPIFRHKDLKDMFAR